MFRLVSSYRHHSHVLNDYPPPSYYITKITFYINHGPVSTICQSEQIIPSAVVVSVVKTPTPPKAGNGNARGIAIGGSIAEIGTENIGTRTLYTAK